MKPLIIFLLTAVIITASYAQIEKPRVAVLQLKSDGISDAESQIMTDRLRGELVKTNAFTIIERGEMDEILNEQGFQMTGCTSSECAVEAGKLLSANQICAGSIGKVGSLFTVSVRLIDVESGQIIKNVTEDCKCPIEEVLTTSMRKVAMKLAGKYNITPAMMGATVLTGGSGDVYIKSSPAGADIYLDNIQTGKSTPATLQDVPAGKHFIKLIKGNTIGSKTVTVKANDIVVENLKLVSAKGGLKIYSDPPEAFILIDGQFYAKTPSVIKDISVGEHLIKLRMEGYDDFDKTVKVEYNQFVKINANLKKMGVLEIVSKPAGAAIYINNKLSGKTPLVQHRYPKGNYSIMLKKEGYITYERDIYINSEKTIKINVDLVKLAKLNLISDPAGAVVYINGDYKGKTPLTLDIMPDKSIDIKIANRYYEDWLKTVKLKEGEIRKIGAKMEKQKGKIAFGEIPAGSFIKINEKTYKINKKELSLPVGEYEFEISKPGYKSKNVSLIVKAGKTKILNAPLDKKTTGEALIRSLFVPGWGQGYQEKTVRASIYSVGFFGSLSAAFAYTSKYNKAVADYNKIRDEYEQAFDQGKLERLAGEMESAYDDINSAESMRNIFYGVTAGIWLWNVIDAAFLPPAWHNKTRFSAAPVRDGVILGMSVTW